MKINPQNELGDIISGPLVALVIGTWHPVFLSAFMHFACFGSGGCAAKAIISYPWSMAHVNINLLTHKNDTLSFGEPCSEKNKSATNTRRVL